MNEYDNMDEWQTIDESDYYAQWESEAPGLFTEDAEVEDNLTDVEADADTLASAGWGTDEDYGYFGEEW